MNLAPNNLDIYICIVSYLLKLKKSSVLLEISPFLDRYLCHERAIFKSLERMLVSIGYYPSSACGHCDSTLPFSVMLKLTNRFVKTNSNHMWCCANFGKKFQDTNIV